MHAIRGTWRQPGLALTVVLVLGVAIGLNATLFTVAAGILWRPWGGVAEPSRVVRIYLADPTGVAAGFSLSDARSLDSGARSFAGIAAMRRESVRVGATGDINTALALMVTGNFFDVLGIRPALGRGLTAAEDRLRDPRAVVVLGYRFWERRFARDPRVLGTVLHLNGSPFTVVGVAPREFADSEPGYDTHLLVPVSTLPLIRPDDASVETILNDPKSCCANLVGRLRPGVDTDQARAELATRTRGFMSFSALPARGTVVTSTAFMARPGRADSPQAMLTAVLLGGALILVWLIACANVGNLLLARTLARLAELSTRLALGATRSRLVRLLLGESFVLALIGCAVGIGVAFELPIVAFHIVAGSGGTALFPFSVTPDASVVAYTVLLGVLSTAGFALAPALLVTRIALHSSLNRRQAQSHERLRLRSILLAMQVAVSVVLLVSAGLLVRAAQRQAAVFDPGFAVDDVTAVSFAVPEVTYDRSRTVALFEQVAEAAKNLPAATFAFASHEPFSRYPYGTLFHLPGEQRNQARPLNYVNVSPEYLKVLRIPLVTGRPFQNADRGRSLVIVNETMARRFWPDESVLGKTFFMRPRGPVDEMAVQEVIGVARDVRSNLFDETTPMFYRVYAPGDDVLDFVSSDPRASQAPVLLVAGPLALDALAPAVARLDSRIRLTALPLAASREAMLSQARWGPILAATLGMFALGLATVGTFGVFAFAVQQRTREIGVRMALGAQPAAVIRLVVGRHAGAVSIGLLIGLIGAAAVSAALRTRLHGLSPFDPLTYFAVGSILMCCGLTATYLPARRAARISPLEALSAE